MRRNVDQARNGGADGIEVPGWAIEVKRVESGFQQAWWEQAVRQADAADDCPALAYRASRQAWRIRLMLSDVIWAITRDFPDEADHYQWIECDIPTFALIVRESLPTQETA